MKKNLISEFYETLKPDLNKSKLRKEYSIKPSSLGTKCMRKLYYSSFRVPEDFDVPENVKKMGAMGDGIAHILSNKFRDRKILIDYKNKDGSYPKGPDGAPNLEFPLKSKELGIKKGYIDAVVVLDDKLWIVEYKSATNNSFKKLQAPKPDHKVQAVTYLFIFNKLLSEGHFSHIKELDKFDKAVGVKWLYVDRDNAVNFNMKEFSMTVNEAIQDFKNIAIKISNFRYYADNKELPPKTPEWCNSCPWREKCRKNYNF